MALGELKIRVYFIESLAIYELVDCENILREQNAARNIKTRVLTIFSYSNTNLNNPNFPTPLVLTPIVGVAPSHAA
jgi:hypothetical protein